MRPSLVSTSFVLAAFLTSSITALQALTNSPCAAQCGNVLDNTSGQDIACHDSDYSGSSNLVATTFKSCVTCQLNSTYVDPQTKETDLQWGLYNLRYAVSWCLFGYPNNDAIGDSPCITSTACGTLENAFEFDSLSPNASAYGYCPLLNQAILPKCTACVATGSTNFFITNYITVLDAGCVQQPVPGKTVSIEGTPWSKTLVNITQPTSGSSAANFGNEGGITLGGKVGIAVAGVVVLLVIAGFCIVWNGKRRRRAYIARHQRNSGYGKWVNNPLGGNTPPPETTGPTGPAATQEPWSAGGFSAGGYSAGGYSAGGYSAGGYSAGGFFDSPQSTKPLWRPGVAYRAPDEEELQSALSGEKFFPPYTSQPASAVDSVNIKAQQWPMDRKANPFATPVSAVDNIPFSQREWPMDRKGSLRASQYTNPASASATDNIPFSQREWPTDRKGSLRGGAQRAPSRSRSRETPARDIERIEMQNVAPISQNDAPILQQPRPSRSRSSSAKSLGLTEHDAKSGNAV